MTHKTTKKARSMIAIGAAAALLSIAGGSVFAGEITGNGTLKDRPGTVRLRVLGPGRPAVVHRRQRHDVEGWSRPRATRATRSRGARSPSRRAHRADGDRPESRASPATRTRAPSASRPRQRTPSAVAPPRPTAFRVPGGASRSARVASGRRAGRGQPQAPTPAVAPGRHRRDPGGDLRAPGERELGEDVLHVGADRARRQAERGRDRSRWSGPRPPAARSRTRGR